MSRSLRCQHFDYKELRKAFPEDRSPEVIEVSEVPTVAPELSILHDSSIEPKTEVANQGATEQVSKALLKCSLLPEITILKVKWVQGLMEPTLVYLTKSGSEQSAEYFIDIAKVGVNSQSSFEFELRMQLKFEEGTKVTDFDCHNISSNQFVLSTIENGLIRLYSLSLQSSCLNQLDPLMYRLSPRF